MIRDTPDFDGLRNNDRFQKLLGLYSSYTCYPNAYCFDTTILIREAVRLLLLKRVIGI